MADFGERVSFKSMALGDGAKGISATRREDSTLFGA